MSEQPELADGAATINFAVDDRWLDAALLSTYAGTTGAEGTEALKGQPKPLALGAPRYVAGTLIDNINTVFQISAYGPLRGFETALERLARFGGSVGDFASYAALVAATVPAGRWATAKAVGMVRLGAPPTGQVSFLIGGDQGGPDGWARLPGEIIRRLALLSGGAGRINDASLDALDVARPYNQSIYVDQQTTARQLIQQIAASVNAVAGMSWTGQLFVVPVGIGAPGLTLAADGSALPPVGSVKQIGIASPFQKLAIGAARAWSVHALSDIAFTATLVDLGTFAEGTTYREGNIVSLGDGSRWLYTATAPSAGQVPKSDSAYWSPLSEPVRATYDDGTPIDDLKPAEPGATSGAPVGTEIGGKPVVSVLDHIEGNTFRHIVAIAEAEIARQRTRALSFLGPQGEDSYTLIRRETTERKDADGVFAETFEILGAVTPDGTAFVLNTSTVRIGSNESMAQRFAAIAATFEENAASIEHIDQILVGPNGASARALVKVDVNGRIIGTALTNDGTEGSFIVSADNFRIEDPDTGNPYFYADDTGKVLMHDVEVDKLKVGSVNYDAMTMGAAQKAAFYTLPGNVVVARESTVQVASITFVKEDEDSILEVQMFANMKSVDDLQFDTTILCDDMVMQQSQVNIVLDNQSSAGQMPITPFAFITGIAAGTRTISFKVYNREEDNANLTVQSGSTLKVVELRKGSIGSSTGSGGAIPSPSPGGGGGSSGGGYNGGGGGAGGNTPVQEV